MRFMVAAVLWIITTVLLAVAIAAIWAQQNIVDERGYTEFAASAARDPALQDAMVDELTEPVTDKITATGASVTSTSVHRLLEAYVKGPSFPGQFGLLNQSAHRWFFSEPSRQGQVSGGPVVVDLAPLLSDPEFQKLLAMFNFALPDSVVIPLKVSEGPRPGRLRPLATWGPWVSVGTAILTGVCALLVLAAARSRGKALAALGVSALIVGAGGWAALEVARGHTGDVLNRANVDVRDIADALINHAVADLHVWLNITLVAGGGLLLLGVVVSMLGAMWRKPS